MNVDLESLAEATFGAIGSLLSTTILYPLDTCKTKFQAEAASHGHRKCSYFRRLHLDRSGSKSIGTKANLVIAAAAGACTAILTQPLDTASSRMQTSAFGMSKGLLKTLAEGTRSDAFDGLSISLLLTSNPAIQHTVFDQLKQRALRNKRDKDAKGLSPASLSAFMAFLLGAVSKSIATFLTYPAIRCRTMIQAADSDAPTSKTERNHRKQCLEFSMQYGKGRAY